MIYSGKFVLLSSALLWVYWWVSCWMLGVKTAGYSFPQCWHTTGDTTEETWGSSCACCSLFKSITPVQRHMCVWTHDISVLNCLSHVLHSFIWFFYVGHVTRQNRLSFFFSLRHYMKLFPWVQVYPYSIHCPKHSSSLLCLKSPKVLKKCSSFNMFQQTMIS